MSYPAYPEYNDSGVEWLGEVPNHWEVRRLKYACRLITKKIPTNGHNVIALENIEGFTGKYIETEQKYSGEDVGFKEGDILLGKLRPYLGKVFLAKNMGVAFGDLLVYRPSQDVNPSYAFSQMISDGFISEVDSSTYGSKMPRAGVDFVNDMPFLLPEVEEQTQIATFLDHETQKIDRLIEKQQQLIKLLQEKRQAVISLAVTKGLNPNAKMKESGVEWLGDIPAHWEIKPLKSIGGILSGYAFDSTWFVDQGVRVLKISNVQTLMLDWSDESYVDENIFEELKRFEVLDGDIVFALTRPIISTGIKVAIAEIGDEKVLLNQRNACFRLFYGNLKEFFYHVLFSQYFTSLFENSIDATGQQPNISPIDIGNIKIFCPALNEQTKIATFLDHETKKIDRLIKKTQEAIQLSKERRTALISAAVTGKIDVRNAA